MKKRTLFSFTSVGQTAVEYLLVFTVVAIVVLAGFNQFFPSLNESSNQYFDTVTTVIRGDRDPNPIHGRWCSWGSCGPDGYQRRECLCPQPAFGGDFCVPTTEGEFNGESPVRGIRECVINEPNCPGNKVYDPLRNACVDCGNGLIDEGENCITCAADAGCQDGQVCDQDGICTGCVNNADCSEGSVCTDGTCSSSCGNGIPDNGETCVSCPQDVTCGGTTSHCASDGICEQCLQDVHCTGPRVCHEDGVQVIGPLCRGNLCIREVVEQCQFQCRNGSCSGNPCGNGVVDPGETCENCPSDVLCGGATPFCGSNGQCVSCLLDSDCSGLSTCSGDQVVHPACVNNACGTDTIDCPFGCSNGECSACRTEYFSIFVSNEQARVDCQTGCNQLLNPPANSSFTSPLVDTCDSHDASAVATVDDLPPGAVYEGTLGVYGGCSDKSGLDLNHYAIHHLYSIENCL